MASDRISRKTAELIALPPMDVVLRTPAELLKEANIQKVLETVPLNKELLASLQNEGILNPLLVTPAWYPIVGSQRVRCFFEMKDCDIFMYTPLVIHRLEKEYWNMFYLWGNEQERDRIIAIWFQLVELAWKSKNYTATIDRKGFRMEEYEQFGEENNWPLMDKINLDNLS